MYNFHNNLNKPMLTAALIAITFSSSALASDSTWYTKASVGLSQLSDTSSDATNTAITATDNNRWDANIDSGFYAGAGLGKQISEDFSTELYWEYRTNDSDTQVNANGDSFSGNFASSIFYLNGYYHAYTNGPWHVSLGAGLGWVQEIDLDLEQGSVERSYSGDGDITWQLMFQADYRLNQNWSLATEARWQDLSRVSLDAEENAVGALDNLDYNPVSLGVNLSYRF
ncbi:outer membrane beta-barrel protein [Alteromonas sp. ASW11-36]|uniref:Outer membrane beta-barrel protein n=1 Tax=Alteromonas arenosi TaxID=3055817 RepID=A0ABT7STF8_9ALTE|nr:outer membrane beta-barrel protein [Alteromonas sp. ASW11-36]MDM7859478.1 outer membrane beta-barrel protein [Alteromonas sp. ASW11-36]